MTPTFPSTLPSVSISCHSSFHLIFNIMQIRLQMSMSTLRCHHFLCKPYILAIMALTAFSPPPVPVPSSPLLLSSLPTYHLLKFPLTLPYLLTILFFISYPIFIFSSSSSFPILSCSLSSLFLLHFLSSSDSLGRRRKSEICCTRCL